MRSLHHLIRQVHLFAGLILAVAIVFYTVSGAAILYARWLPRDAAQVVTERVAVPPAAIASPRALRAFVAREFGARGRGGGIERRDSGAVAFRFVRPGMLLEAETTPDRTELVVTRTTYGPVRVLRTLHTLTGYSGGAAFAAWSVFLDLVALATIGFALSGIYLWYKLTRRRRLGWLLLSGSWCYTLGVILYLWLG